MFFVTSLLCNKISGTTVNWLHQILEMSPMLFDIMKDLKDGWWDLLCVGRDCCSSVDFSRRPLLSVDSNYGGAL